MNKYLHKVRSYLMQPTHPVTVSLVGLGGTGSLLLTHLGRISAALRALGHPGLYVYAYDPDTVSRANVGRGTFSPADVGRSKAITLVERVNRFYGLSWKAVPGNFSQDALPTNVFITCVDTVKARDTMLLWTRNDNNYLTDKNGYQYEQYKPYYWIDTGNNRNSGQVIVGTIDRWWPPESTNASDFFTLGPQAPKSFKATTTVLPHVFELYPEIREGEEKHAPSCSVAEALSRQDLMINPMMGQLAADLLWKMIRYGEITMQGYFTNLESGQTRPIPVKPFIRDKSYNPHFEVEELKSL